MFLTAEASCACWRDDLDVDDVDWGVGVEVGGSVVVVVVGVVDWSVAVFFLFLDLDFRRSAMAGKDMIQRWSNVDQDDIHVILKY